MKHFITQFNKRDIMFYHWKLIPGGLLVHLPQPSLAPQLDIQWRLNFFWQQLHIVFGKVLYLQNTMFIEICN